MPIERSAPIITCAKSWHTPSRVTSTSASGVSTSVLALRYVKVAWMRAIKSIAAAATDRPGVNDGAASSRNAGSAGTNGDAKTNSLAGRYAAPAT